MRASCSGECFAKPVFRRACLVLCAALVQNLIYITHTKVCKNGDFSKWLFPPTKSGVKGHKLAITTDGVRVQDLVVRLGFRVYCYIIGLKV